MIQHNKPTFDTRELEAAASVIHRGWVASGVEVDNFENEICQYLGLPEGHCVVVSSGSAALYLALWALKATAKTVAVPVYSCSALSNAVGLIGANPIYFDTGLNSPNIDFDEIERSQQKIEILIAPSIYGMPVKIPARRNFLVIEDIAQALGALVDGAPIGTRGDIGICSFYATKMITSGGQGGAVVSKEKKYIEKIKDYLRFDCRGDSHNRFNFQLTDLQAAIGRVQLSKLPTFLKKREMIIGAYRECGVNILGVSDLNSTSANYRAIIKCNDPYLLIKELSNKKVRAIVPVEEFELLDKMKSYPNATNFCKSTISLPCYPSLEIEEVKFISKSVNKILHDS